MHKTAHFIIRILHLQIAFLALVSSQRLTPKLDGSEMVAGTKLEDTVLTDMLQIVDHKFDTLTTRISALERAVSGLQFFSIRQFRQLSGFLKKTQTGIITVGKKVSQIETDGRGLKIAMSLLNRDVTELKSTTTDTLTELEASVVYINDNVDKQARVLQKSLGEQTNKVALATDKLLIRRFRENEVRDQKKEREKQNVSKNCTVDLAGFQESLKVRLDDFKHGLMTEYFNPLIDGQNRIQNEILTTMGNNSFNSQSNPKPANNQNGVIKTVTKEQTKSSQYTPAGEILEASSPNHTVSYSPSYPSKVDKLVTDENGNQDYGFEEHDNKILNTLMNITTGVFQATNYFRQSGGMMEEMMSNMYDLYKGQLDLKVKLQKLITLNRDCLVDSKPVISNDVLDSENTRLKNVMKRKQLSKLQALLQRQRARPLYQTQIPKGNKISANCNITDYAFNGLATIVKNGSQLLEMATDLVRTSSTSLSKTTLSLKDGVARVEKLESRLNEILSNFSKPPSAESKLQPPNETIKIILQKLDLLNPLMNFTNRILQVVESNKGWLRLLYRNNQHVEVLTNRSLSLDNRNYDMLIKLKDKKPNKIDVSDIAKLKQQLIQNNKKETEIIPSDPNGHVAAVSGSDFVLDKDSIQTIYSTSQQLNRIMPALTKLLAEPDPLITLVNGGDDNKGRLEIYYNGQWGTICHKDLTHHEAGAICRHLGFLGGFSAGAGRYEAGSGVAWSITVTCLEFQNSCAPVKLLADMSLCDHEKDAAVICDHMLRIVENDTETDHKIGRLEILHQGLWLPVCGEAWSGFSARVACKQMGYVDGREQDQAPWPQGTNSTWLNKVACNGNEPYLDECRFEGWSDSCKDLIPAGVRCL